MISRPSIVPSLAAFSLPALFPRPLLWGLFLVSLCTGLPSLTRPALIPRAFTRIWGPLPPYTLLLHGGDTCLRCPGDAGNEPGSRHPPAVRLDAPLDIVLHPAQPVTGPVFVYAFLGHGGRVSAWPILMEHAADSTLRLRGIVRDLLELPTGAAGAAPGTYELIFVIQRSLLPPSFAAAQARAASAPDSSDPQLRRGEIEILAPANP